MVCLKSLLLLTTTASAATTSLLSVPMSKVLSDVTTLDNDVKTLIATTGTYTGGYAGSLPSILSLTSVYSALFTGVIDSGLLSSPISISDAWALISHVNSTLAIDNPLAVKTLMSKKAEYQAAGLDGIIVGALQLLKAGHDSFSYNVLSKAPDDTSVKTAAQEVVEIIDAALQEGINYFETS